MTENKLEAEVISEKKLRDVLSYFSSLIFDATPPGIPDSISDMPEAQKLVEALQEVRHVLIMAKNGDFSYSVRNKGFIPGSLKALQSNFNHIIWFANEVADGDFEQRIDFMGEFASAFNAMTKQLNDVLKKLNEQKNDFSHRAFHDQLTGLKNRAYFDEHIINEIARAKRSNSRLAVVVIDLDKFKQVNDTMGHRAGDILLIEFAKRISKSTREIDTTARIGGDEFGMLIPCSTNRREHLIKIKDRIVSHINAYFELEGSEYKISASLGISIYPHDGSDPRTLLGAADAVMYEAKKTNGTWCVFTSSLDKLDP